MNPAVVAPAAAFTLAGTVTFALLLEIPMDNPPVGAALLSRIVQAAEPGEFNVAGEQVTLLTVVNPTRLIGAVLVCPPNDAVRVAASSALTVAVVAWNVPLLAPALIVTLAGTVSAPVLLESVTDDTAVAGFVRVAVQVAACADPSVPGEQLNDDSRTGATRISEAVWETPLAFAVTTAVWSAVMVGTVATNEAVVAPAATVTLAGTAAFALLLDNPTATPPVGAALLRATVHAEDPGALTVPGEQVSALKTAETGWTTVIVPAVFVVAIEVACAPEAMTPPAVIARLVLVEAGEIVNVATAMIPLETGVVFSPKTRHFVEVEVVAEQVRSFPAAVAAAPGTTVTLVMSVG